MLKQSSEPVPRGRQDLDGDEVFQLHETSTLLIQKDSLDSLYGRMLDAAMSLMSSDMACLQLFDPKRNQLRLLAWKGLHPRSAIFWEWVSFDSASVCGLALSAGCRVVVQDIETSESIAGTPDLNEFRRSNIRAVQSTPLVSRSGHLLGMISTLWREPHQPTERALRLLDVLARQAADLIERGKAEAALRESNDQLLWLTSIVENSDDSIVTANSDGTITSWNQAAERLFGYTAEETVGKSATILIPPKLHDDSPAILARIRRGERVNQYETIRQRKDGSVINISLTVSPIKNAQGKIVGASAIARDITERKRNDEHIATLAREAEHRTKNILATVQATVHLSHSNTADGLKRAIEGRLEALTKLHDLFVKSRWTGAELSRIAAQELAPYVGEGEARARIDGPYVLLAPNTAQAIAVMLHELGTNAVKYGALSVAKGRVEVKWSLPTNDQLILTWTEKGGPAVRTPLHKGFGTRMMEEMIRDQQQGDFRLDWGAEGLACEIILPV
jgi:PAS domain S-box-containing protein